MLLLLAFLSASKKFVSVVDDFKSQLAQSRSENREDYAILWALAELARQVDKSVTGEEVAAEIGSRISEILERLEVTDTVLKRDFDAMHFEFQATKSTVEDIIADAKRHIIKDIEAYKAHLIESLQALVYSSKHAQEDFVNRNVDKLTGTYQSMRTSSDVRSIVFFLIFQVVLLLGIVFYNKVAKQLRMFL